MEMILQTFTEWLLCIVPYWHGNEQKSLIHGKLEKVRVIVCNQVSRFHHDLEGRWLDTDWGQQLLYIWADNQNKNTWESMGVDQSEGTLAVVLRRVLKAHLSWSLTFWLLDGGKLADHRPEACGMLRELNLYNNPISTVYNAYCYYFSYSRKFCQTVCS